MSSSEAVRRQAAGRRMAVSLVSRSAYLLYSALSLFITAGFLAASPASVWAKLKIGFPLTYLCVTAYHVRLVWVTRPLQFWDDIRIKLAVILFAAACTAPMGVLLYFIFFPPHFGVETGASLFMSVMAILFLFYGGMLLVSPALGTKFDFGDSGLDSASDPGKRIIGGFLFLVGIVLAYFSIRIFQLPYSE